MMHPHVEKANAYARDVVAGRIPACKWVRAACQRHINDLARVERDASWPYRFDETKGERVCKFIELLPHVEGQWAAPDPKTGRAQRLILEPWQCFIVASLFGWVKKATGKRRFRRASIYVPRKNAKSTLAAGIGLWMFAKDGEHGAQVYCGATSEDQAWKVFGPAREMAKKEPDMQSGLGITVNARSLTIEKTFSRFEPIIGKPGDGASPHLAIIDEYHEHSDPTQYNTMKTGMGARSQPLLLVISTAGDNLTGPCVDDWSDCEKLLDGVIQDETHFAIIWTIDGDGSGKEGTDNWTDARMLAKANPNWGVSVIPDGYLQDHANAIRDVKKQGDFKTKHLNLWVGARGGWLNMEQWKACADKSLTMQLFAGCEAWVGLDAASKIDMTSMTATVRHQGGYATFARHYIPEDTVALPQNAHYRKWVAEEWLIATPGARVDFTIVEEDLRKWSQILNIQQLAFDPKELNDFINRVGLWAGFQRVEVPQGAALMSEPMKEMEACIATGKYRHQGDPVLTWMASNVIRKEARGGGPVKYYYPTKAKAENKIDGIVAGIMALSRAMLSDNGPTPGIAFV